MRGGQFHTNLTKVQARRLHRPTFLPVRNVLYVAVTPERPSKGEWRRLLNGGIQTQEQLSLCQRTPYVMFEYSEEIPPLMMNAGMATLVNNYYRKRSERDQFKPADEFGGPVVLDVLDQSPFPGFGEVPPGTTMPVLFNNLFRAPIFRQPPPSDTFLLVMCVTTARQDAGGLACVGSGGERVGVVPMHAADARASSAWGASNVNARGHSHHGQLYVHELPAVFVVGQTFPTMEVPTPKSHKMYEMINNYVQVVLASGPASGRRVRWGDAR